MTTALSPLAPVAPGERVDHRAVTGVVCVALAAVVAAMSSLNVALPDIARSTHASESQLTWIVDAYSLFFAALLLPAGALGDRFGRRRMLLVGLGIFGVGSAVAMTADGVRELGDALGIAVVGSVLSSVYRSSFTMPHLTHAPSGAAAGLAAKAEESFAIAAHLGGPIAQAGTSAFVDGLHLALLICSGAALAAAVLVGAVLPTRGA